MKNTSAMRKVAMVGLMMGVPFFGTGCAIDPQGQQIIQAVVGLLGAAVANGAGPLQGPVTSQLPVGAFGAAPAAGAPLAPGTTAGAANDLGSRVKQAAYNLPDPFPYADGTEGGNLGCADVVSHALEEAGVFTRAEHDLAVVGVRDKLKAKGWTEAAQGDYRDGDVIIWGPTSGGSHKHIGIIVIENGQTYAINNSSSQKRPTKTLLSGYNRTIEGVLRNPGSVQS